MTLLRHKNVKLYTLFKTDDPENDTLTGGTSLYMKHMGVIPPGPQATAGESLLPYFFNMHVILEVRYWFC